MNEQLMQNQTLEIQSPQIQEWENNARDWICTMPKEQEVTMNEVEVWINSNQIPLPEELKSLTLNQIYERVFFIQQLNRQPNQAKEPPAARFQRTDQWKPVYAWLESLDKDEVVKSKDITDWLEEQPSVKEKLCARHSRYHLMHYIQKCHMKILKRRGKLQKVSTVVSKQKVSGDILVIQGVQQSITKPSPRISYDGAAILALPLTATPSRALITNKPSKDLNRDKDESAAKREEAFRRYELLTELGKQLSSVLSQHRQAANMMESAHLA